jgi:hypothetical protein
MGRSIRNPDRLVQPQKCDGTTRLLTDAVSAHDSGRPMDFPSYLIAMACQHFKKKSKLIRGFFFQK